MNKELKEALDILEEEKSIDKKIILDAIRVSLENAYRNYFAHQATQRGDDYFAKYLFKKEADGFIKVVIDENSYDYEVFLAKEVIDDDLDIMNDLMEIKLKDARLIDEGCQVEDIVYVEAPDSINLGHTAIQNSKGLIIQKLREQEKNSLFNEYKSKEGCIVTGVVGRRLKKAININLGRADGVLLDSEMVKDEKLSFNDRIKVYVQEVTESTRGPKIKVSRSDPNLVRKLFENEVSEIEDGTVVIKSISREAGSRTKIAVYSNNPNVDAVGSCLGVNSVRVNEVVEELRGEKIDIVNWDEDISNFVENALLPAKSIIIVANEDSKDALVIVPDLQLSLAIGKEGQNVRLAARLTGYKIDIKSETQAVEQGIYDRLGLEYDHNKYKKVEEKPEEKPVEKIEEKIEENENSEKVMED